MTLLLNIVSSIFVTISVLTMLDSSIELQWNIHRILIKGFRIIKSSVKVGSED